MKPYYEHAGITIYHGDCREVLPTLEVGSCDICITSPPYNVGTEYESYDDNLHDADFRAFNEEWLRLLFYALSTQSRFYAVVSDKMIWWMKPMAEGIGFPWAQLLVWCKPNMAGGGSRFGGDWASLLNGSLMFRKGKRTPMLNGIDSAGVNTHNYMVIPRPAKKLERRGTEAAYRTISPRLPHAANRQNSGRHRAGSFLRKW